jgi:hypothetical protein
VHGDKTARVEITLRFIGRLLPSGNVLKSPSTLVEVFFLEIRKRVEIGAEIPN